METVKAKRRLSIRTRLIFFMLVYIALVFLIVIIAFNVLVEQYIKNTVYDQLKSYLQTASYEKVDLSDPGGLEGDAGADELPLVISLPRGPVGRTEAIVISEDYDLIVPDIHNIVFYDYDEVISLVSRIKTEAINLQSDEITQLTVSGREYYLVSLPLQVLYWGDIVYLITFVDLSTITGFADRLNTVLLVVMGIAIFFALLMATFISGILARPIRELTRFAARIGRGDFTANTTFYQDLELAELAESMNTAAHQLETYDREQKTFFQNVSHELRTPLQSIRCNAEGIEQDILENRRASHTIIAETDRLSDLVEDLLYLSRIDSFSREEIKSELDLRELLSNSAERLRVMAAEKNLQFRFDFAGQPVLAECSEKQITRAFSNLIANAIRYARQEITLTCKRDQGQALIMIADDGQGIDQRDLPHIFKRFYKGRGGKHGIGLAIAKTVIEQHRGQITVKSSDQGAVFTINLPLILA